jgi:hypothetical protein
MIIDVHRRLIFRRGDSYFVLYVLISSGSGLFLRYFFRSSVGAALHFLLVSSHSKKGNKNCVSAKHREIAYRLPYTKVGVAEEVMAAEGLSLHADTPTYVPTDKATH